MINLLQRGEKIPELNLMDDEGNWVTIPDPNSYVLLLWDARRFAQACKSCASQAIPFITSLESLGVKMYGVSLEDRANNAEVSLFEFDNRLKILSADKEVAELFGTYRTGVWEGIPHRAAFLIGADGTIVRTWLIHEPQEFKNDVTIEVRNLNILLGQEHRNEKQGFFKRIVNKV